MKTTNLYDVVNAYVAILKQVGLTQKEKRAKLDALIRERQVAEKDVISLLERLYAPACG